MGIKNSQQIIIKITCVIVAFGLWLYVSNLENTRINRKIKNVKVELVNMDAVTQAKLAEVSEGDYTITITVEGQTSEVNAVSSSDFKVVADMGTYALKKGDNLIPVEIKAQPEKVKVLATGDMAVKVVLDDLTEKTVPVELEMEGVPKSGYATLQPEIKPSEVTVKGAAKYISRVVKAVAKGSVKNVDKDVNFALPLVAVDSADKPVEHVIVAKNFADIVVPVKKIKTVGINVKVKGNLPSNGTYTIAYANPEKIDIAGDEEITSKIQALDTEPIDLSTFTESATVEVKLVVPKNVRVIGSSEQVKVRLDLSPKLTERTLSLNVAYKNADSFSVTPATNKVEVKVSGEDLIIKALNQDSFECYLDFSGASEGKNTYTVVVKPKDPAVKLILTTPDKIEVTLTKK